MFGMDTMTVNKIAGALLGSGLLVMGLNILADSVYHAEKPEQAAIAIEVAEGGSETAAAEARSHAIPPGSFLATRSAS